jgi:hypothetical protein
MGAVHLGYHTVFERFSQNFVAVGPGNYSIGLHFSDNLEMTLQILFLGSEGHVFRASWSRLGKKNL